MPTPRELDQRRQRSLKILINRISAIKDHLADAAYLKDELADLFNNIAVCWRDETFYQALIELIETVTNIPLRYGMLCEWDDVLCSVMSYIASDDVYRMSLICTLRANIAYEQVRKEEAYEWAKQGWDYAYQLRQPQLLIMATNVLLWTLSNHFANYSETMALIEQTEQILQQLQTPTPILLYIARSSVLRRQGKIKQARQIAENMADDFLHPDMTLIEQTRIRHIRGLIRWADGAYALAETDLSFSAELFEKLREFPTASGAYGDLGLCYWSWGKLPQAEDTYAKAFELALQVGDVQREMKLNGNLGLVYMYQGRLEEATQYIKNHIERAEQLGSEREYKRAIGNWAQLHLYFKQPHIASSYLEQVLGTHQYPSEGRGNDTLLASLYYHQIGDVEQARRYLAEIWQICDEGEHTILPILAYRLSAEVYPDVAIDYLHKALALAHQYDRRLDIAACLLKLAERCENRAYYEEARALLAQMNALRWLTYETAPILPLMI